MDLGLPEKFDKWRTTQEHAFEVVNTQALHKRILGLALPTGSGKSPLAVGIHKIFNQPTCIVTESRGLQNQLMGDFESMGMTSLMGRDNYQCEMREDYSCHQGKLAKCPHVGSMVCPYSKQEAKMAVAELGVTNYAKWMTPRTATSPFTHFQQVIFDEGHAAPNAVASAMQVKIYRKEIEETLAIDFPPDIDIDNMGVWKAWARNVKIEADAEMKSAESEIQRTKHPNMTLIRHYSHMKELVRRLGILMLASPSNWICDQFEHGYIFDPIRPGRYAEALLFCGIPRIVIMSATLRDKTLKLLGLSPDTYHYQEFDSEFNPKDAPIYFCPTVRVDAKISEFDLHKLYMKFDQFIYPRSDRKGLIDTVSYARQEDTLARSRFADRMIVNEKGEPPTEIINTFRLSEPGTILVSPSVGTGYDFPGPDLEWIILSKIPFEPPSKIVKARDEDDKGEYRGYRAIQDMDQLFGRHNRFTGDRGESLICDDHMMWFIRKYGHFASKNFHRRYRVVNSLPSPLPKM